MTRALYIIYMYSRRKPTAYPCINAYESHMCATITFRDWFPLRLFECGLTFLTKPLIPFICV